MKKHFIKLTSLLMTVVLFVSVFSATPFTVYSARSESQIKSDIAALQKEQADQKKEIARLEKNIKDQEKLKAAIEKQISLVQREIHLCNQQINDINSKISSNKAEISKINKEIEADKLDFKKRLRAIYMSSSDNSVQILLGAEDFSQFLQLSQLTASVSARDKLMIEKLVDAISVLEEKQKENNKLLEEQKNVKEGIVAKQNELKAQNEKILSVIKGIAADKAEVESDNEQTTDDLKAAREELEEINRATGGESDVVYDGKGFAWPVPAMFSSRFISSRFRTSSRPNHNGIDISNGSWGAKIVAIADGEVKLAKGGCTHDWRKKPLGISCGCGGGYGNYVVVDHGKSSDGVHYAAWYAHMSSLAVRQGQSVKKGQTLGYVGCTGRSTGPHLHFGIKVGGVNGTWKNPLKYYPIS